MHLFWLFFFMLQIDFFLSSVIIIKTNHSVFRKKIHNTSKWQKWIKEEETQQKILTLNPVFLKINKINSSFYNIDLTPMYFQGVEIKQKIDYDVSVKNCTMAIKSCFNNAENTILSGTSGIYSMIKITDLVVYNVLSLHKFGDDVLSNEESIELTLELPTIDWILGLTKTLQILGSKTIKYNMNKNMNLFIDNIVQSFDEETIPKNLDPWVDWIH